MFQGRLFSVVAAVNPGAVQPKTGQRAGVDAFPVTLTPKFGGWPLPREVQAKMEASLNANFSDVRIHVGPEAAVIGAIAFTWGSDIHFAPGQYNPHSSQGQFLLGHELAHVVQQRSGRVNNPFGSGVAVVQDHALEAEADRLGRMASQTTAVPASETPAAGGPSRTMPMGVIHRKVNPHLTQARMPSAVPGSPARSACLPPAPPAGVFPVQAKMSRAGAAMNRLGAAAIQPTRSRVIQRKFVRAGGFTWIDKDTDKRYEQVEAQFDDRIKLSDGTKTFYIISAAGSWNRVVTTASTSSGRPVAMVTATTSISTGIPSLSTPSLSSGAPMPSINTVAAVVAPMVAPVVIAGGTAVTSITAFLKAKMRKDSNYCTALLANGDLIVSKVNGVTGATTGMDLVRRHITANGFHTGRHVYLAQKYNTSLGSNHAEMCILAAARALGQTVTQMACTGPNCPYCAKMLKHENVASANAGVDGKAQQGWAHPYDKIFWGSQVSNLPVADQVKDLKKYLKGEGATIGKATITSSAGKSIQWI
jgi:hypothetical protein